jgi:hypothetical protein
MYYDQASCFRTVQSPKPVTPKITKADSALRLARPVGPQHGVIWVQDMHFGMFGKELI